MVLSFTPHIFKGTILLWGRNHRIAHLHDDVMRALHSGSCSQRKTKWRLIAEAGSLAVFQGVFS